MVCCGAIIVQHKCASNAAQFANTYEPLCTVATVKSPPETRLARPLHALFWNMLPSVEHIQKKPLPTASPCVVPFSRRECPSSAAVRRLFTEAAGEGSRRLSKGRWFSRDELLEQLNAHLPVVEMLVRTGNDGAETPSGALKAHLREVFDSADNLRAFRLELTAYVEVAEVFVKMCYLLEGDGFLAPLVFDLVQSIQAKYAFITNEALPRSVRSPLLWETICEFHHAPVLRNTSFDTTMVKMLPAFHKLLADIDINGRLNSTWAIFRGCRLLDYRFTAAKPIIALEQECNCLLRLTAVSHLVLGDLLGELGQYHAPMTSCGPSGATMSCACLCGSSSREALH